MGVNRPGRRALGLCGAWSVCMIGRYRHAAGACCKALKIAQRVRSE